MGKIEKWLVAVKKVFATESKGKKGQKKIKSKKGWGFGRCSNFDPDSSVEAAVDNYSVVLASTVVSEAAAGVVRLTKSARISGWSKEEVAAVKIQTAFRGYLSRRALWALRGLVRLKTLTHSNFVKHQAVATLRCMQTLTRIQAQIRSRRIRMSEENQALQRQLQLKHERELANSRMAADWDDSLQSKEQIEARLQNKQEAAIRRERALAYAFAHQWKSSSRSANPMFMDPNNPQWGWSWLERWMGRRPWENRSTVDRDLSSDCSSLKSVSHRVTGGEIARAYARRDTNQLSKSGHHGSRHAPSSHPSVQSEQQPRRHSIAGCSVRDDVSLASATSVPSYMAPTESAKAKSRYQSLSSSKIGTSSNRGSQSSARKRLSFSVAAPAPAPSPLKAWRHSGPPKVDVAIK